MSGAVQRPRIVREPMPRLPWWLAIAALVASVAAISLASLWLLGALNERATRRIAASSFLDEGRSLTAALAEAWVEDDALDEAERWRRLSWCFDLLSRADPGIESLGVERDGLTVFRRQAGLVERADAPASERHVPDRPGVDAPEVIAEHVLHEVGGESLPVVLFSRELREPEGARVSFQLGLRRSDPAPRERLAEAAVRAMYRVALATQGVTLGALLALGLWLHGRERRREQRRRDEEHLAFAGMMANGIVHDFRNPMSAVQLDAQLLERECGRTAARPERLRALAGRIRETLERIDSVFQEFFFLSRPTSGCVEPLDLDACLRECVALLQGRLEGAGLRVVFLLPPDGLTILAQAAPLRRALLNVLSNAIVFSPPEGEIALQARREGHWAVLDVLDRGPGIPPGERERVFEMFVTSRPEGTGLGLFLARTALAVSDGTIEALSREGGGSCLRIRLRLEESASEGAS